MQAAPNTAKGWGWGVGGKQIQASLGVSGGWAVARQSGRWPLNNASKGQNAGQGATLWEGAYFVLAVSAQGLGQRVGSEEEAWQQS